MGNGGGKWFAHYFDGEDQGQHEANARLIAAAPELYEAAKKVYDGLCARIDMADPSAVPIFTGIAELHDALNRACGEQVSA